MVFDDSGPWWNNVYGNMEAKVSEKIVLKEGWSLMRSFTWKCERKGFRENSLKRRVVLDEIIYMEEKYES